jgi:hypothetical protein
MFEDEFDTKTSVPGWIMFCLTRAPSLRVALGLDMVRMHKPLPMFTCKMMLFKFRGAPYLERKNSGVLCGEAVSPAILHAKKCVIDSICLNSWHGSDKIHEHDTSFRLNCF